MKKQEPARSAPPPKSLAKGIFDNIDKIEAPKVAHPKVRLKGELGEFLGDMEKYRLAITLEGDQGGGKTQFAFQLVDAFADLGMNIGVWSIEIGKQSDLIERHKENYIKPKNRQRVFITDNDQFDTILEYASKFDVVVLDSFTKVKYQNGSYIESQELDRLRNDFPNTIFVPIFQRNSKGTIRGGPTPLFDAGVNIEVVKVDPTFVNNYAFTEKNRYGAGGIKYNISKRKIIKDDVTNTKSKKPKKAA